MSDQTDQLMNALQESISGYEQMILHTIHDQYPGLRFEIDTQKFFFLCRESMKLALSVPDAKRYLQEKKLSTYGDVLDMHQRIMGYLLSTDPAHLEEMENKIQRGSPTPWSEPEFYGGGRLFLNIPDFLVAIPHVPHSPNPEQPTILGLLLSATQTMFRNENIFLSTASHSDLMHFILLQGTILSAYARTTTGESIYKPHPKPDLSQSVPGTFLFEDFNVINAVPFHPEYILLTAHPRILPNNNPDAPPPTVQVFYNALKPGASVFLSSPGNDASQSAQFSSNFSPEFMRVMQSILL